MDCLSLPEIDLGDWSEALLGQLQGRRYPLQGSIELTERCNLACVHCYINQPAASRAAKANELSTDQVKGLIDQMAQAGCLFLNLTGGEILLRDDFSQIYRHIIQRGILVSLLTNGTLLTADIADLLAELRPRSIEITLYGATAETYERVTRRPGSYARLRKGINLLLARGLPLSLKSTLITLNKHELQAMKALAEQLSGDFHFDHMMFPRLNGGQQVVEYQLSPEEIFALEGDFPEVEHQWYNVIAESHRGQMLRSENVYVCNAGLRSFHIDSRGRMSLCIMSRRPSFDLLTMDFQQAWDKLGDARKSKRQLETACRTCTINGLCLQCPGWAQAVHGDDETPVAFVCTLAHLRAARAEHRNNV